MKLAVIIGHDAQSRGARGVWPINKSEYEYNSEIAQMMFQFAKSMNMECRVFRRDKIGIEGVYKLVNDWADLKTVAIELHFNAFNGKARGTETLFDHDPEDSVEFAREIHEQICILFNRHDKLNRGLHAVNPSDGKHDRGETNLVSCKAPSCIVEPFFGDNKDDAEMGYSLRVEYAKCLVVGAKKFLKDRDRRNSMN